MIEEDLKINNFLSAKYQANKINFDKPPKKPTQEKKRDKTLDENIFYRPPNTFFVNAQKVYINLNGTPKKEDSHKPSKQRTCLQNKHSLIINNLNYACENKRLNVSSNTTKHKRHCTDHLQIDPDFTYINLTHDNKEVYINIFYIK